MMIKRIALLEPRADIHNIYSLSISPRLGLLTIGALLRSRGYEIDIFIEGISKPAIPKLAAYDLVGISVLTNTAPMGYRYAELVRCHGTPVVMGGPHVTFLPEEGLRYADYVVRGEGEETLPELLDALNNGRTLRSIRGLSYREQGNVVHNPDREPREDYLDVSPDYHLIKGMRAFSRGPLSRYRFVPLVSTSRGCPYNCLYCTVIRFAGRKPRYRPLDACLREIRSVAEMSRKDICIADDNFTMNVDRTKQFLRELIALKLPAKYTFMTQIRMDAFRDDELLALLRDANFEILHVGYESVSQHTLEAWRKRQSVEEMSFTVDQAKKHGLRLNAMFIVGSDCDTEATIRQTADWAIDTGLAVMQMWILTPLPGSEIFDQLSKERRIFNTQWAHYDCQHSVFFPRLIRPSRLQDAVRAANERFYAFRRLSGRAPGNRLTYGINAHLMTSWMKKYARRLETIEDGLYADDGCLRKDASLPAGRPVCAEESK
jgi:radical SAM superfamily enzyme YgiQ (UPF0313 family)